VRYFIDISYIGKNFHGWQIQENSKTIQSEVDVAISKLFKKDIKTVGSGRTDTGVHALSQVAHFDYEKEINNDFIYRVNSVLPNDISINSIKEVKDDVSARFDAISREYIYKIHTFKSPFLNHLSFFYKTKIDVDLINETCSQLLAYSDFQSFSKVKTDVNNYNCKIKTAHIKKINNTYLFTISSNRFLRGMVRAIVGTLLQVNENKKSLSMFDKIILGKDRKLAGPSVPAHGLYLSKVTYKSDIFI